MSTKGKPEILYPCEWEFRIIGESSKQVRDAVLNAVNGSGHSLSFARFSQTGRYLSFRLVMVVQDEAQRDSIYRSLSTSNGIKMIL